jgi:chromosome segregation ATPase
MAEKIKSAIIVCLFLAGVFFFVKLHSAAKNTRDLENRLGAAQVKVQDIERLLEEKKAEVAQLKDELAELSYPRQLKTALSAAQSTILKLNEEIRSSKSAKASMEEKNVSLESRLRSSAGEISRLLKELDQSREKIQALEKDLKLARAGGFERRERSLSRRSDKQNREVESELRNLKLDYSKLREERDGLRGQLDSAREALEAGKANESSLSARLQELAGDFRLKNNQIRQLQDQVANLKSISEKKEELQSLNRELQDQIVELTRQTESKEAAIARIEQELQGDIKERDKKIESLQNEFRELAEVKEEKGKLEDLNKRLKDQISRISQELKESQMQTVQLEENLKATNKLEAFNEDLEKRMGELSVVLKDKEREIARLKETLREKEKTTYGSKEVDVLRNKLYAHQEKLARTEDLYDRLKGQLKDIDSMLTQREIAIAVKEKEIARLQDELAEAESNLSFWEKMSSENKGQQEKLMNELSRALDLNATLQQQLTETSVLLHSKISSSRTEDKRFISESGKPADSSLTKKLREKEKVEELKKKIEIILKSIEANRR